MPFRPVLRRRLRVRKNAELLGNSDSREEAFPVLVPGPDFKSGGGRGDTASAGSIPVRFRQSVTASLSFLPEDVE